MHVWTDLANRIQACNDKCSYELAEGFTTPAKGFKHIHIGDAIHPGKSTDDDDGGKRTKHITIDGKGKAVIDAHGK